MKDKVIEFRGQTLDSIFQNASKPWQLQLKADLEASNRVCQIDRSPVDPSEFSFLITRFSDDLYHYNEEIGITVGDSLMGPAFIVFESVNTGAVISPQFNVPDPTTILARVGVTGHIWHNLADALKIADQATLRLHNANTAD